jgi:hypothetical protein
MGMHSMTQGDSNTLNITANDGEMSPNAELAVKQRREQ